MWREQDEESIRGALSLKDHDIQPCPETEAATSQLPYAFAIRHKTDAKARVHVLQASSLEERDKWISALRLAALLEDDLAVRWRVDCVCMT